VQQGVGRVAEQGVVQAVEQGVVQAVVQDVVQAAALAVESRQVEQVAALASLVAQ